jgi:hypothetical protein
VPFDIKQNQGGLRRSKKVQQFDLHPTINIYWDPADTFFDGASILEADDVYRQAAFDNSQDKEKQEGRFFLQLKHCNVKGGKVWFLALVCMMVQFYYRCIGLALPPRTACGVLDGQLQQHFRSSYGRMGRIVVACHPIQFH